MMSVTDAVEDVITPAVEDQLQQHKFTKDSKLQLVVLCPDLLGWLAAFLEPKEVVEVLICLRNLSSRRLQLSFVPATLLLARLLRRSLSFPISFQSAKLAALQIELSEDTWLVKSAAATSGPLKRTRQVTLVSLQCLHNFLATIPEEFKVGENGSFALQATEGKRHCLVTSDPPLATVNLQCSICNESGESSEHPCGVVVLVECRACNQPRQQCNEHSSYCTHCDTTVCCRECLLDDCLCIECGFTCAICEEVSYRADAFKCDGTREGRSCINGNLLVCEACEPEFEISTCSTCNRSACNECDPIVQYCEACKESYCLNCKFVNSCETCNITRCDDCKPFIFFCDGCTNSYCPECETVLFCSMCSKMKCTKCEFIYICDSCDTFYCMDCKFGDYCDTCKQIHCSNCRMTLRCFKCFKKGTCVDCFQTNSNDFRDILSMCGKCFLPKCLTCDPMLACAEVFEGVCMDCLLIPSAKTK